MLHRKNEVLAARAGPTCGATARADDVGGAGSWSLPPPASLARRKPSSLPLGALLFGRTFWLLLIMKREVYGCTLVPAAVALVAEGVGARSRARERWPRIRGRCRSPGRRRARVLVWAVRALVARRGRWSRSFSGFVLFLAAAVVACAVRLAARRPCSRRRSRAASSLWPRGSPTRVRRSILARVGERARPECRDAAATGSFTARTSTSREFYGVRPGACDRPGRRDPGDDDVSRGLRRRLVAAGAAARRAAVPVGGSRALPTYGSYSMDELIGRRGASRRSCRW